MLGLCEAASSFVSFLSISLLSWICCTWQISSTNFAAFLLKISWFEGAEKWLWRHKVCFYISLLQILLFFGDFVLFKLEDLPLLISCRQFLRSTDPWEPPPFISATWPLKLFREDYDLLWAWDGAAALIEEKGTVAETASYPSELALIFRFLL